MLVANTVGATDGCVAEPQYCGLFISSVTKGIAESVKTAVLQTAAGRVGGPAADAVQAMLVTLWNAAMAASTSAGLVWSSGAKARIVPALYQCRSRSAICAPWSLPWS